MGLDNILCFFHKSENHTTWYLPQTALVPGLWLAGDFHQRLQTLPRATRASNTQHSQAPYSVQMDMARGHGDTTSVDMQNVPPSQDINGRTLPEGNSEAGSEIHQCFSMLEDIEQEPSKCCRCCKTFFYGTKMAFVYVLSVIFLLAACLLVVLYVIIMYSVPSTARNLYVMVRYNKCFDMCYYNRKLEKKIKKGRDRLYAWFNYFDKQYKCLECKTCLNILTYVFFFIL